MAQIQDEGLRNRIEQELDKITKTKKFGLVFEQHLPECTPLFDMPIKVGVNVMHRNTKEDGALYVVLKIENDKAVCGRKDNLQEQVTFSINDIVRVAEFGESIYPFLKPIDSVCNAPNSDLWHCLIEADNYHALQLLEYLYAGKVDCIYIDPPYNTGAKDWKCNNNYVAFLEQHNPGNIEKIEGYLISDTMADGAKTKRMIKDAESGGIFVKSYSDLLTEARRYNKQYFDLYETIKGKSEE